MGEDPVSQIGASVVKLLKGRQIIPQCGTNANLISRAITKSDTLAEYAVYFRGLELKHSHETFTNVAVCH